VSVTANVVLHVGELIADPQNAWLNLRGHVEGGRKIKRKGRKGEGKERKKGGRTLPSPLNNFWLGP